MLLARNTHTLYRVILAYCVRWKYTKNAEGGNIRRTLSAEIKICTHFGLSDGSTATIEPLSQIASNFPPTTELRKRKKKWKKSYQHVSE